jgi:hypothetical protein
MTGFQTISLAESKPTEQVGRDTLSRYDMQFQAAAFAALEILEGKEVTCVYCDFHEDFVVRREKNGQVSYHFHQVKTKGKLNHQWNLLEIFSLKKKGNKWGDEELKKLQSSFAAKLVSHAFIFADACGSLTLVSNVHFADEVIDFIKACASSNTKQKIAGDYILRANSIFEHNPPLSQEEIQKIFSKLVLQPAVGHIGADRESFINSARTAIIKYSEIDLTYYEIKELAKDLLELVYRKSRGPLKNVNEEEILARTSISRDDMLRVLSISPEAYQALLDGHDPNTIRTASILQRVLSKAKANPKMIEYASGSKVEWDMWFRNARHVYKPFDLEFLLQKIDDICSHWRRSGGSITDLRSDIASSFADPAIKTFADLTPELLLGAILASLVRSYS